MKISSASKKVLASALSAAMVVAFAPAAALAKPAQGDFATIHFEVETGANASVTDASLTIADVPQVLGADGATQVISTVTNAGNFKYYGKTISGWWYDKDGDGVLGEGENLTSGGTAVQSFVPADSFKSGGVITLKAIYDLPAVTAPTSVAATVSEGDAAFTVTGITGGSYDVKVTKDGSEVFSKAAATVDTSIAFKATDTTADFNTLSGIDAKFDKSKYGEGKYVVSLTSASGDTKGYTATCEFEVCKVSLKAADARTNLNLATTDFYIIKGGKLTSEMIPGSGPQRTDGKEFDGWYGADGVKATDQTKVTANTELTATFADARVAAPSATLGVGSQAYLTFQGENLTAVVAKATKADQVKEYKATISGPGVSFELTGNDTVAKAPQKVHFCSAYTTSDGKLAGDVYTSAAPQAGTYTYTLTQVNGDGSTAVIGTKSIELVAISYELGEGNWNDAQGKDQTSAYLKNLPTLAVKGGAMDNVWSASALNAKVYAPNTSSDSLNTFDKWAVSGLTDTSAHTAVAELADGASNVATLKSSSYKVDGEVKLTASYKSAYAAAPTASIEGGVLTVAAAEGTTAYYKVDSGAWAAYTAPVTLAASAASVTVKAYAGTTASKEATFTKVKLSDAAANNYKSAKQAIAGLTDFEATKSYLANLDVYKKAVEAADATFGGWNKESDWAKVAYTATGTVLGAYADVAEAAIDGYAAGSEQKDGSLKRLTAEKAADAKAAVAAVEAAWLTNNAAGSDTSKYVEVNGTKPDGQSAATTLKTYYDAIKAITDNAAKSVTTYAADDVKAAAAVNDALKAATDGTAAQAAIDAYQKLTDTQKALVDTSALAAAHKVVDDQAKKDAEDAAKKAAEELVKAQDKAAVAGITGKTVKAKAKKKVIAKLAGATSESGAVVTFSKKSGNAKVKIGAAGKITVKKGLKKGKKYTVKVTASCGSATKVVKVVVKVVK